MTTISPPRGPDPSPTRMRLAPRWVAPVFAALALALIPWIAVLTHTLPTMVTARHWSTMWVGFDVILGSGLAGTSLLARRRDRRVAPVAAATAALLIVDAWCDVTTAAPGHDLVQAAVLAVVVELPLAAVCAWISHRAS
jgi:hypothetical protein